MNMVTPTHRGTGMRVSAPCMMLNLKSFLLFSVDLLSRGGGSSNAGLSTFVDFFFGKKYSLFGVTVWNGGHCICTFQFSNVWFMYDG